VVPACVGGGSARSSRGGVVRRTATATVP
jgi:hypothetical protein